MGIKKKNWYLSGAIILLSLFFVWFLLNLQSNNSEKSPIQHIGSTQNDFTKKNKSKIHAIIETHSFSEALEISDVVAKVKIIETVTELDEPSAKTIFHAEVTKKYKGEIGETINVMQEGNSKVEFNGTRLFEPGEEYILTLMETTGIEIENTYWILGAETGIYEVLDNDAVVKWAKSDAQLKNVEYENVNEKLSTYLKNTDTEETEKELQVLYKEKFEELIETSLKK